MQEIDPVLSVINPLHIFTGGRSEFGSKWQQVAKKACLKY